MVDCAGVAISDISDHYGIFVNINCKTNSHKQKASIQIRDMKNFKLKEFIEDLNQKLESCPINDIESVDSQFNLFVENSVDSQFNLFVENFLTVVNNHAPPPRQPIRKEKRLQQKPWLNAELLKQIKLKNKMYAKLRKFKDQNQWVKYKLF